MTRVFVEKRIGKGIFRIETGLLAKQAAGAVTVQYGETVVLSAVASGPARAGIDYFPLTCDYREFDMKSKENGLEFRRAAS